MRTPVKPVFRGHLWDKLKVFLDRGDFLKEVQFMLNCLTGHNHFLLQVTA